MQRLIKRLLLSLGVGKNSKPPTAATSTADKSHNQPKRRVSDAGSFDMDQCFEVGFLSGQRVAFHLMDALKTERGSHGMYVEWNHLIEEMLVANISKQYPMHQFITKNTHKQRHEISLTDAPTWFIDPLGAPNNFAHGFPYANISLAFWMSKQPRFGIIWNPLQDECYTARVGFGSQMNVQPLKVSNCNKLEEALVMCESRSLGFLDKVQQNHIQSIANEVNGLRSLGSCSLSMCMVAQGYADAYIDFHCTSWDMSAAILLVKEAGGVVCDPSLKPFDLMSQRVLCAATKELAEQLAALLNHREEEQQKELVRPAKVKSKQNEKMGCPKMNWVPPKLSKHFHPPSTKFSGYPKSDTTKRSKKYVKSYPTDPSLPGQSTAF